MAVPMMEQLAKAAEDQTQAVLALNQTIQTEAARRFWVKVLVTFASILLVIAAVGAWFAYSTANQARKQGKDNHESLEILKSATTPGSKLYEEGAARTAKAVCGLIEDNRQLHGVDIKKYPCDKPLPVKPETAPTNQYRGEDGFCFGTTPEDARQRGLTPDPTCGQS